MEVTLPEIAIVRSLSAAGPYAPEQMLALAYSHDLAGRLSPLSEADYVAPDVGLTVPDFLVVRVVRASAWFMAGDMLTLWFSDPLVVRIARSSAPASPFPATTPATTATIVPRSASMALAPAVAPLPRAQREPTASGVRVRLRWTAERARRIIGVADRLFTIERLGWYRHVLAMRLLLPDDIVIDDEQRAREAASALHELRTGVVDALGRPLLAACMPNFAVSSDWLDTLDSAAAAKAAGRLLDVIAPDLSTVATLSAHDVAPDWLVGLVQADEPIVFSSVDALLPLLIPTLSTVPAVTACLTEYRRALVELFGQTARAPEAVRLKQMVHPNHALDDRLWQLVAAIADAPATPVEA
jgi:hypothetical protein